jgi:DNA (cytosine-5)-methyltransferase 1
MKDNRLNIVDIFCGAGGFSEGFRQAGYDVLLGIDCNPPAIMTYNKAHSHRGRLEKIENIDASYIFKEAGLEDIDVFIGGPPCQAFSHASIAKWKSLGRPSTIDHPLNKLYKEFFRLVIEARPKFFVMENVERMLSIGEGFVRKTIEHELSGIYSVSFQTHDAADFGVPQHRRRILIIGNRLGIPNPLIEGTHSSADINKKRHITVFEAISDLPSIGPNQGSEFINYPRSKQVSAYARERRKASVGLYNHVSRPHNNRDLTIFRMLKPGQTIKDLPKKVNPYRSDIFRDKYKKQVWKRGPSSTILAHMAKDGLMFIHPDRNQNRTLTPREAARLQSFDDKYKFEGTRTKQYVQIGNAVPPLFARTVAYSIKNCLKSLSLPVITCLTRNRKLN